MDHERADREVWAMAERRCAVLVKLPEQPSEAGPFSTRHYRGFDEPTDDDGT